MKKSTLIKLRDKMSSGKTRIQIADNISLPVTSTRELTPEGYLKATAAITKVGVQMYSARDFGVDSDELVGVFRPPETVFHPETMESIKLKPITTLHPETDVDSTNVSRLSVGTVGETVEPIDSERLGAAIQITDEPIVKAVLGREIEELSLGYDTFVISMPGTFNGQDYLYQIDGPMICNHLAIVPEGRCGDSVKILDKGESVMKKKYAVTALRDAGVSEDALKKFMVGQADDAEVDMNDYNALLMSGKDIDMTQLVPAIVAELKPTIEEMVASPEFQSSLAKEIAAGMVGGGAATPGEDDANPNPDEPNADAETVTPEMMDAKVKDAATARARLITDAMPLINDENFDIHKATNRDIIEKALAAVGIKPEEIKDMKDAYLEGMLSVIIKDRADAGVFMKQDFNTSDGAALGAPMTGIGARKMNS